MFLSKQDGSNLFAVKGNIAPVKHVDDQTSDVSTQDDLNGCCYQLDLWHGCKNMWLAMRMHVRLSDVAFCEPRRL